MKKNILMTIGAAAVAAITLNATASSALLSPRAAGNQIKIVASAANDPDLVAVDQGLAASPRTAGNQITTVASTSNDMNPAAACADSMSGSPKTIQACAEHPGSMLGCTSVTVAPLK